MVWQRLFNTDEDLKNRPFIDTSASIPINTCKFTKNYSYIDSNTYIPTNTHQSTILDHPKYVVVEAYIELKKIVHNILETINCSMLMLNHQVCQRKMHNYYIVMLQDYCLQAK